MPKVGLSLIALCLAGALTHAASARPTFLAVVDGHGALRPIAIYDGTEWWNRWPWGAESEELRNLPVPDSLAAIPADWLPPGMKLPARWQAFADARRLVPVRAQGLTRSPEGALMTTINIQTDYRGRADEEDTVAISGPGVLGRFASVSSQEREAILRQVRSRIAASEDTEVARWKSQVATDLGAAPIALRRTYRVDGPTGVRHVSTPPADQMDEYGLSKAAVPIEGRTFYQLHGDKLFTMRDGEDCMMRLSTHGVIAVSGRGTVESAQMSSAAYSEYCGDAAEMAISLATITIERRTWWIQRIDLEDGFDYSLVDPMSGEAVPIKGLWDLRSNGLLAEPHRALRSAGAPSGR